MGTDPNTMNTFFQILKRMLFGDDPSLLGGHLHPSVSRQAAEATAQPSSDYFFTALKEAGGQFLTRFNFDEFPRLQFKLKQVNMYVPTGLQALAAALLRTPASARKEAAVSKLRALDPDLRFDLDGFQSWNVQASEWQSRGDEPEGDIVEETYVYTEDGTRQFVVRFEFLGELLNREDLSRQDMKARSSQLVDVPNVATGSNRYLFTYREGGVGPSHSVQKFPCTVGSGPDCDIRIESRAISRLHFVVLVGPNGQLGIRDTSTNGTWLNGGRLQHNEFRPLGEIGEFSLCAPAGEKSEALLTYQVVVLGGGLRPTEIMTPVAASSQTAAQHQVLKSEPTVSSSIPSSSFDRVTPVHLVPRTPAAIIATAEKRFGDGHTQRVSISSLPFSIAHGQSKIRLIDAHCDGFLLAEQLEGKAWRGAEALPQYFVLALDGRPIDLGGGCSIAICVPSSPTQRVDHGR